jgi:hypothetical protein
MIISPPGDPLKPLIGYENLFLAATITSSGDEALYPKENAYDWNPATFWEPSSATGAWLKADFGNPVEFDYFAIYAQDLWKHNGTIELQHSPDNSSWTSLGVFTLSASRPYFFRFTAVTKRYFRVLVEAGDGSTKPFIGVMAVGKALVFERGFFVGFAPPIVARNTVVTNSVSQNGVFLGRTMIRKGIKSNISMDMLSQAWVRNSWLPFILHAETPGPFFLQWNHDAWPAETTFCWSDGAIPACQNTLPGAGFMSAGLPFVGNTE